MKSSAHTQPSRTGNPSQPTKPCPRHPNHDEHRHPGDLVHVDIQKVGGISLGGERRINDRDAEVARASTRGRNRPVGHVDLYAAVDNHSLLAYAEIHADQKDETAGAFWLRAVQFYAEHGIFGIECCRTDNGSTYRGKVFKAALTGTRTTHMLPRPHPPRLNDRVDRFLRPLKAEWPNMQKFGSDAERAAALAKFVNRYNHKRPQSSLGNMPPASRVPVTTYRMQAPPEEFREPRAEDLGNGSSPFD